MDAGIAWVVGVLIGFFFGGMAVSWMTIEKLKTHDLTLVKGHPTWIQRGG